METNEELADAARIRRAIFLPLSIGTIVAGSYGIYQLSYRLWKYLADEILYDSHEINARLWLLGACLLVTGSATAFLSLAARGRLTPGRDGRSWCAAAILFLAVMCCHVVGSYNAMPARSTEMWTRFYWSEVHRIFERATAQEHRDLLVELRAQHRVSPIWLVLPFGAAAAALAVASRRRRATAPSPRRASPAAPASRRRTT